MLHIDDKKVMQTTSGWIPIYLDTEQRFSAMSIGFLLPNKDSAVVWRGPKKNAMIKQFVESVSWGDLDVLVVDTPPGTSDEHLAIIEAFANHENISAVIVTTPQLVAIADVEKEIAFCKTVNLQVDGIIENMSGYKCKSCAHTTNIFSSGGGQQLAEKHGLKFLGKVPISPEFSRMIESQSLDLLTEYSRHNLSLIFRDIFKKLSE
jgi:Mrp family chromosome partitioning ATPase